MREHLKTDFFEPPPPRVVGHRGSAGTHPENTLESFRAAVASGVHYLEFDIHMTRDGEIVVAHDEHLKRMCGLDRVIPEMTYAELAAADAGRMFTLDGATFPFREKGIKLPRLFEVLAEFPKLRMIVEVKQIAPSVVAPMLDVLDRAGMRRNVLVASEHQAPLDEVRKLAPDIPTNFSYLESGMFIQAMGTRDAGYRPPGDAVQIPHRHESWELVTRESVDFAHRVGVEVHVWTVNEEAEMTELLEMGVDGLISDYPARALDMVRRRTNRR
ncbi:MAG TPA: glycerophosphodiester phosphodiesterase [Candidatus Binatus sp.]|uniref:glycerophosphodiester phosphodiesterase n=1 Tax=Candidatus Binatus sp. TaxID=2811406 RepID=UPI002F40AE98